jgi:hypothetical protein
VRLVHVEPYVLTEVPKQGTGLAGVTSGGGRASQPVSPTTSVTSRQARFAANLWLSAFVTARVDKLVQHSIVPFHAGGKSSAQTPAELEEMFRRLVAWSRAVR